MSRLTQTVSLHPYFKVNPGQMEAAKSLLREFVTRAATEDKLRYYEFTINGDEIFCREGYDDAEGTLVHLANVGTQLDTLLSLGRLIRLEVHGPANELDKLRGPLGAFSPAWFAYECGVTE